MISQYITFCLKHTPVAPQELQDLRFLLNHQKVKTKIEKGNKLPLYYELRFFWQSGCMTFYLFNFDSMLQTPVLPELT